MHVVKNKAVVCTQQGGVLVLPNHSAQRRQCPRLVPGLCFRGTLTPTWWSTIVWFPSLVTVWIEYSCSMWYTHRSQLPQLPWSWTYGLAQLLHFHICEQYSLLRLFTREIPSSAVSLCPCLGCCSLLRSRGRWNCGGNEVFWARRNTQMLGQINRDWIARRR